MRDKYGQIVSVLKGTNISIFGLALALFVAAIFLASLRLRLIIEAQDIPVTVFEAFSLTFIGYFFNNFLPTTIGGDVAKAYYVSRHRHEKVGSFAAVFVDRVIGLITMVLMAFVMVLFADERVVGNSVRYSIYIITLGTLVVMFLALSRTLAKKLSSVLFLFKPIENRLREIYGIINKYQNHKVLMAQSFGISVISQMLFFISVGILALSIGSYISVTQILLRMPIIGVVSLLPSINGLGLREGSTVVFFGPLIGKANAFAVSVLWLALLFIISIAGGIIYLLSPQFKVKLKGRDTQKEAI